MGVNDSNQEQQGVSATVNTTQSIQGGGGREIIESAIALDEPHLTQTVVVSADASPTQQIKDVAEEEVEYNSAVTSAETEASTTATDLSDWSTPERITDVSLQLKACVENDSPQLLTEIRQTCPNHALLAAVKLLSPDVKAQIKQWVVEQNAQAVTQQDERVEVAEDNLQATQEQDVEASAELTEQFREGDRVWWERCPGHYSWANPFTIMSIEGNSAMIDLYSLPVPLSQLVRHDE